MVKIIVVILLLTATAKADAQQQAIDHITTALYKQTGLEEMFTKLVDEKVSKNVREQVGRMSPFIGAVLTQRLDIKWNF